LFWNWKTLFHKKVDTSDGFTGRLTDLIFDQIGWAVRYIRIDSSTNFLQHKEKIISSLAVKMVSVPEIKLYESYTKIENSEAIGQKYPLTRDIEKKLHDHYGWKYYWDLPAFSDSFGNGKFPDEYKKKYLTNAELKGNCKGFPKNKCFSDKNRLELCTMLIGASVQSIDEEVGKVDDFIVDDTNWVIRYLICTISENVLPVHRYIPILLVTGADMQDRHIYCSCGSDKLKSGIVPLSGSAMDREFEARLHAYFEIEPYW
jgi:hypothetical protein